MANTRSKLGTVTHSALVQAKVAGNRTRPLTAVPRLCPRLPPTSANGIMKFISHSRSTSMRGEKEREEARPDPSTDTVTLADPSTRAAHGDMRQ